VTGAAIDRQPARRRDAAVAEWGLVDEIVLIGAGDPMSQPTNTESYVPEATESS
jgi:hypothetical protein